MAPTITLLDVKGLSVNEQADLMQKLNERCNELSRIGSVMVLELVQVTEDFLYSHNIDPTMSAYDVMKAREEEEERIQKEKEQKLHSFMDIDITDEQRKLEVSSHLNTDINTADNDMIQKRLEKQDAAFEEDAGENDLDHTTSFEETLEDDDDADNDDYQFDEPADSRSSNSRYKSDFIELGMIGRGGGGTVFKVRNRLDRRIYAVKKVILQSEQGKMQQLGKLENSKLRREVTTISRMTHRHIVRYYQAWVEGGDRDEGLVGEGEIEEDSISVDEIESEASESEESSDDEDLKQGFWGKRPSSSTNLGNFEDDASGWSSSSSESDSDSDGDTTGNNGGFTNDEHSNVSQKSKSDEDYIFPDGPLMRGLGFENQSYSDLFKRGRKESITSSDDLDVHSSMMSSRLSAQNLDSKNSNSIMYIQMEYCPR